MYLDLQHVPICLSIILITGKHQILLYKCVNKSEKEYILEEIRKKAKYYFDEKDLHFADEIISYRFNTCYFYCPEDGQEELDFMIQLCEKAKKELLIYDKCSILEINWIKSTE